MTDPRVDFAAYKEEVGKSLKASSWPMTDNFGYEAIVSSLLSMLGMKRNELPYMFSRLGGLIDPTCIAVEKDDTYHCGNCPIEVETDVSWVCSRCGGEFRVDVQEAFDSANHWERLIYNPYDGERPLRCDYCGSRVVKLEYLDGRTLKEEQT